MLRGHRCKAGSARTPAEPGALSGFPPRLDPVALKPTRSGQVTKRNTRELGSAVGSTVDVENATRVPHRYGIR